jgi:hypothetical protein
MLIFSQVSAIVLIVAGHYMGPCKYTTVYSVVVVSYERKMFMKSNTGNLSHSYNELLFVLVQLKKFEL